MEFDTPTRLQKRILEAAGDFSEDVSLPGLGRRAPSASTSFASVSESSQSRFDQDESINNNHHQQQNNTSSRTNLPNFNISQGRVVGRDSTNAPTSHPHPDPSTSSFSLDTSIDKQQSTKNKNKQRGSPTLQSVLASNVNPTSSSSSSNTQKVAPKSSLTTLSATERLALSQSNRFDRSTDTNSSLGQSIPASAAAPASNRRHLFNASLSIPQSSTPQSNNTRSIISGLGTGGKASGGNFQDRIQDSLNKKPKTQSSPGGYLNMNQRLRGGGRQSGFTNTTTGESNESWRTGNEGARSGTGRFQGEQDAGDLSNGSEQQRNGNESGTIFKSTRNSNFSGTKSSRSNPSPEVEGQVGVTSSSSRNSRPEAPQRRRSKLSNLVSEEGTTTTRTMHTSDIIPSFDVRNARMAETSTDEYDRIGLESGRLDRNNLPERSLTYDESEVVEQDQVDRDLLARDQSQVTQDVDLTPPENDLGQPEPSLQRTETNDTYTRDISASADVTPAVDHRLSNGRRNFGVRISPGESRNNRNGISPTPSPERSSSAMGMATATKTPRAPVDPEKMREHLLSTLKHTGPIVNGKMLRDHHGGNRSIGQTPRVRNRFNLESSDQTNGTNSFGEGGASTSPLRAGVRELARANSLDPSNQISRTPASIRNSRLQNLVAEEDGLSYASSESSNDLTVPARNRGLRRGNTSLPGGVGATPNPYDDQRVGPSLANVDPIRMGAYQNIMSKQLEKKLDEQQIRIKELETNWNKALRENEMLRKRGRVNVSPNNDNDPSIPISENQSLNPDNQVGDQTFQELEEELNLQIARTNNLESELDDERKANAELEKESDEQYENAKEFMRQRDEALEKIKEFESRASLAASRSRSRLNKSKTRQEGDLSQVSGDENQSQVEGEEKPLTRAELEDQFAELGEAYNELYDTHESVKEQHVEAVKALQIQVEAKVTEIENGLKQEIRQGLERICSLEEDLRVSSNKVERLQEERAGLMDRSMDTNENASEREKVIIELNDKIEVLDNQLHLLKQELDAADQRAEEDQETFNRLEDELAVKFDHLADAEAEVEELKVWVTEADQDTKDAVEKAEALEKQVESLRDALVEAEKQAENAREKLVQVQSENQSQLRSKRIAALSSSMVSHSKNDSNAGMLSQDQIQGEEELQKELDQAYMEIGKLQNQIQNAISSKENDQDSNNQKDSVIAELRERVDELTTLLEGIKDQHLSYSNVGNDSQATPRKNHYQHKGVRDLKSSPFKVAMNSPGVLSEVSWLGPDSTIGGTSVMGKIEVLQARLAFLNADIDHKLDNWPSLNKKEVLAKLEFTENRVLDLEAELKQLRAAEPSSRPRSSRSESLSKSSDERNRAYTVVVNELNELRSKWANDVQKFQLQKEEMERVRSGLQSRNDVMSREAENQRERERIQRISARKTTQTVRQQLERARKVTEAFELELKEGRSHLEALDSQSRDSFISRSEIEARLAQTETKFSQVQQSLLQKQRKYEELNDELLQNSRGAGDVHIQLSALSNEVAEAKREVERIQVEKEEIINTKSELKNEYQKIKAHHESVYAELRTAREAMYAHQEQLDEQVSTIEALHAALNRGNMELEKASGERDRLSLERGGILSEVKDLHSTLLRLRREGGQLSEDMSKLRSERDMWKRKESEMRDLCNKLRREAEAQLDRQADRLQRVEREIALHQCLGDQSSLEAKHASECKGLMLQIRYLKAKFMRESDLRADLTHQKSYLLQLIGGLELSEAATAQFIADVGVSRGTITPTRTPSRTFKKVALAVKASVRMQLMTKRWRETCEVKATLREAHSANAKLRAERERFARGV